MALRHNPDGLHPPGLLPLVRITLRKCKTSRSYAAFVSLAFALINIQLCQ